MKELLVRVQTKFDRSARPIVDLNTKTKFDDSRPFAFMHIPKTSGMSLAQTFSSALQPAAAAQGFDHSLFGYFRDFDTFDSSILIYDSPKALPAGCKFIAGHFALSTIRQAYPHAQISTVLRDPISRLLSHWMYWRHFTDPMLMAWGKWADKVRYSRQPLANFLNLPEVACQTDNVMLRMLLWPHPLIKEDQFISPVHDRQLLSDAVAQLRTLDFVDVIENGDLVQNLERWIGLALTHDRINETSHIPDEFRSPLHRELTPEAYKLLGVRSRLDLRLWETVVKQRLPDCDANALRERSTLNGVARYGALMEAEGAST